MHPAAGFEPVVAYRDGFLVEEVAELFLLDAFLADGAAQVEALLEGHAGIDLGGDADAAGAEVLGGILGVLDGHGGHRGRCLFGHGWSHSASIGWVWVHL